MIFSNKYLTGLIIIVIFDLSNINAQKRIERYSLELDEVIVLAKNWKNEAGASLFLAYGRQYRISEYVPLNTIYP